MRLDDELYEMISGNTAFLLLGNFELIKKPYKSQVFWFLLTSGHL